MKHSDKVGAEVTVRPPGNLASPVRQSSKLIDSYNDNNLPGFKTIREVAQFIIDYEKDRNKYQLKNLKVINHIIQQLHHLRDNNFSKEMKDKLMLRLQEYQKNNSYLAVYYGIVTHMLLASFKTTKSIITRLSDTKLRKLNRRLKYAWTGLKHKNDGAISHNFVHNVGTVPDEYIEKLKTEAPKMQKDPDILAPYFITKRNEEGGDLESMIVSEVMQKDFIVTDLHHPKSAYDTGPCAVHPDGQNLRSDCIVCKKAVDISEQPIIVSKTLLKKVNVTENLLKFLWAQQQQKNAARNK